MKKTLYAILFCLFFSFGCDENDGPSVCGVQNPVEDIAWLKQLVEDSATESLSEYAYIKQGKYKGEQVFYWGSCCPNCNWALVLRDCSGNAIEGEYTLDDIEDQKVIWQPENSLCSF